MIEKRALSLLGHEPTSDQIELTTRLGTFIRGTSGADIFILRGYAGTGKTTIISSFVKAMSSMKWKFVLLAPTGRAAKVFAAYSESFASTIHRKIYHLRMDSSGNMQLVMQKNKHKYTLFIVDESSMIGEETPGKDSLFGTHNLLDDLVEYVYSGENCRLVLVGDTAQLPPVGLDISPALDDNYLKNRYFITTESIVLTQVLRQAQESGVLFNATMIRSFIADPNQAGSFCFDLNFPDISHIAGNDLKDILEQAYSDYGIENTLVICRSNKRANLYNQHIRNRILFREEALSASDLLMVVRNNYHWLPEGSSAGFIANGDILEILRVRTTYEMYGFNFASVTVRMVDYPHEPELDTIILLDTLSVESAALPWERSKLLYEEVAKDYEDITTKTERRKKIKADKHLNALQVKFAYAVTCHKAQGGQWPCVFVEQGFLPPEMRGTDFMRWLYTATTRSFAKLYLVNFDKEFLPEGTICF
ncbi:MAG: AAA family ATPase [Bacteroidetes bacterium]|nr:AAA family ATPase [Bacteroidota bacterium]MBU1718958.1 AAA family ATPase [Bacteroidota bacterium]